MATTKKTAAKATPKAASTEPSALEKRVADLESKLDALIAAQAVHEAESKAEHARLESLCEACCAKGGSGADVQLRAQLKAYFSSVRNNKVQTQYPVID